jgi:hypothetical protein
LYVNVTKLPTLQMSIISEEPLIIKSSEVMRTNLYVPPFVGPACPILLKVSHIS